MRQPETLTRLQQTIDAINGEWGRHLNEDCRTYEQDWTRAGDHLRAMERALIHLATPGLDETERRRWAWAYDRAVSDAEPLVSKYLTSPHNDAQQDEVYNQAT